MRLMPPDYLFMLLLRVEFKILRVDIDIVMCGIGRDREVATIESKISYHDSQLRGLIFRKSIIYLSAKRKIRQTSRPIWATTLELTEHIWARPRACLACFAQPTPICFPSATFSREGERERGRAEAAAMAAAAAGDGRKLAPVRIFVGGLGEKVTEVELKSIFESKSLGRVEGVDIVRTKGRSFAYCNFLPSSTASLSKLFSMVLSYLPSRSLFSTYSLLQHFHVYPVETIRSRSRSVEILSVF